MSTENDAIARAEKQLEDAKRNAEFVKAIREALPAGLKPYMMHAGGYMCAGYVKFEVERLCEALPILKALPGVPVGCGRGTFVTLAPLAGLREQHARKGDYPSIEEAAPFIVSKDIGHGYGGTEVEWWTELAGCLVKTTCALKFRAYSRIPHSVSRQDGSFSVPVDAVKHGKRITRPQTRARFDRQGDMLEGSASWEWYFHPDTDPADVLTDL